MDRTYGLGYKIQSFAVANDFVVRMNKGCFQLGKSLQPFCFFANDTQNQWGVLDITQFSGFVDSSKTLVQEIAEYRRGIYNNININFGMLPYSADIDKALFYDYLLSVSLCYIEIPKYITKNGVRQKTYDKFFATRNPSVMGAWMGYSPNEMQAKYSARIQQTNIDFISGELRAVKLVSSAKGNSITCPRNNFSVKDMTCIPLFMLYAFENGFYDCLKTSIIKFTYLKDNDVIRELPSTINFDILMDYYSDNTFIAEMLAGVDIFSNDQGGMLLSTKQSRGYIKLPELGCSKYDHSGVRSLNISRLLGMEVINEVDRTFINVDLENVVSEFKTRLDSIALASPNSVKDIYAVIHQNDIEEQDISSMSPVSLVSLIDDYVDNCDAILTTSFKRSLHMFMVSNPQWFGDYTGVPSANGVSVVRSSDCGIETMDF